MKVYKTYKHNEGYLQCRHDGKKWLYHRVIYEAHFGTIPEGHDIHHRNGDRTDNRIENLQCLPHGEHIRWQWEEKRRLKRLKGNGDNKAT